MPSRARRLVGLVAILLTAATPLLAREGRHAAKRQTFEDARMMIEYNSSGPDIGVQIAADAEAWRSLKIFDSHGKKLFDVFAAGNVGVLGVSELFSESDEPSLDDLPLDEFLALFPEGQYSFVGETPDGEKISGRARFTHIIPAAPVITGPPAAPQDRNNVVVTWQPVPDPAGSQIVTYQVIIEHGDPVRTFQVDVPASVTSVKIAPEYLAPGTQYNFEVIAWEAGDNHTITEGSFTTSH